MARLWIAAALVLAGCKQAPVDNVAPHEEVTPPSPASQTPSPPPSPAAAVPQPRHFKSGNRLHSFEYSYPAAVAAIPELRDLFDERIADHSFANERNARAGWLESKQQGLEFRKGFQSVKWSVVADLPGWLSLLAEDSSYTGGAHGNFGFQAMLWDKAGRRELAAADLFASPAALSSAIREPFCAELDRQRASKRGEPVERGGAAPFSDCIDPVESTIILGSADRRHFTRIGVMVGPYEAGPWAEGSYEVTLPVTAAVLAAVKPEFRASFAEGR